MPRPIIHDDPESEARRAYQREWHRKKRLSEANYGKEERQEYYKQNREARLAYQRAYYEENKEQVLANFKTWYDANRKRPRQKKTKASREATDSVKKESKTVQNHNIKIVHGPVTLNFD